MAVMSVFMTIFTGAVVSMAKTTVKVEAVTSSASQVNSAFLRLDSAKYVRYANAITTIGQGVSGAWYVELDGVDADASEETCTQLRVLGDKLQSRTWPPTSPPTSSTAPPWTTMASNITNGGAAAGSDDQPFSVPTGATSRFQQLTVTLVSGVPGTAPTRSQVTFTALNSSVSDAANVSRCQQQLGSASRP